MGRYYYGDIQGKFMFAVQSSEALSRFGKEPMLSYSFCEEDVEEVSDVLKEIESNTDVKKIELFFKANNYYSDDDLIKAGISRKDLSEFADWELGKKLLDKLNEVGECNIECEL